MSSPIIEPSSNGNVRVRRARVGHINVYEVKEEELEILEKGTPITTYLTFAVFFLTSAITCFASLMTADFTRDLEKGVFIVVCIFSLIFGLFFLFMWKRSKTPISDVVERIRSRMIEIEVNEQSSELPPKEPDKSN